jgi:uncharacterized membrane protein
MAEDYMTGRLAALTDGVLGIAMTLLVLDIRLPVSAETLSDAELWQKLLGIWPQIFSYGLSFLVVAVMWISHVQKFRHLTRTTPLLLWLNVLFLLGVGFVPFTTALLAENGGSVSTAVYALGMAFASLMLALMSAHVRLAQLSESSDHIRAVTVMTFGTALVFLASAAAAAYNADWAKDLWFLLIPLGFIRDRHGAAAPAPPAA